jgi:hypothetical protein
MITPSVEWFGIIVTFNYLLLREMGMHIVDFEKKCYYRLLGLLTLCCLVVTLCTVPSGLTLNKIDDVRTMLHFCAFT